MSRKHNETAAAVLGLLAERWPQTFSVYERHRKPLKIGITKDLEAELDGAVTPRELHRALACYVNNPAYLFMCCVRAPRFDLSGAKCGRVTEAEAAFARERLTWMTTETAHNKCGDIQ